MPPVERVVVDGSNIATEGRQMPSLKQLDEAVRAFMADYPHVEVSVIVDATFGHRIDDSERKAFDDAVSHGELVAPPAGAVGRGDAFLLQVADRVDATVLSNDSFQEFHGTYKWLFDENRLMGGKPVPGVGWIFMDRTPVRGPKSREAVRGARQTRARVGSKAASKPMPRPAKPPPKPEAQVSTKKVIEEVAKEAVEETDEAKTGQRRRRRRRGGGGPPTEAVNDPLAFIQFIANHKLGAEIEGEVESFSSHGAFVTAEGARCYIPLSAMGDPPPRSARSVLQKGEIRTFVVQALDAPRRGVELALPGHEHVSGVPTEETVEAEITRKQAEAEEKPAAPKKRAASKRAATKKAAAAAKKKAAEPKRAAAPEKVVAKKKAAATKKAATPAKKVAAKKKAAVKKKAATKKKAAAPKKAAAKKKAAVKKKAAATKKKSAAKKRAP